MQLGTQILFSQILTFPFNARNGCSPSLEFDSSIHVHQSLREKVVVKANFVSIHLTLSLQFLLITSIGSVNSLRNVCVYVTETVGNLTQRSLISSLKLQQQRTKFMLSDLRFVGSLRNSNLDLLATEEHNVK